MSDNPFSEPDDSDRTVIRPVPGGRRAAPPPQSAPAQPAFRDTPPPQRRRPRPSPATARKRSVRPQPADRGRRAAAATARPAAQHLQPARSRRTARARHPADRAFEQAARDGGVPKDQLRPAHYALCASLDDVVLNTPWGSSGGWAARSLVSTFHQEVRSGERFFDMLGQLRQNPGTFLPVLELMYLCLSLGFLGRYRLSPHGPGELDRLREDLYAIIVRQRQAADPALSPHWQGVQAPYRPARAIGADLGDGRRRAGGDRRAVHLVLHRPQRRVRRRLRAMTRRAAGAHAADHPRRAGAPAAATAAAGRRAGAALRVPEAGDRPGPGHRARRPRDADRAHPQHGHVRVRQRHRGTELCPPAGAHRRGAEGGKGSGAGRRLHRQPADPHRAVPLQLPVVRHRGRGRARDHRAGARRSRPRHRARSRGCRSDGAQHHAGRPRPEPAHRGRAAEARPEPCVPCCASSAPAGS